MIYLIPERWWGRGAHTRHRLPGEGRIYLKVPLKERTSSIADNLERAAGHNRALEIRRIDRADSHDVYNVDVGGKALYPRWNYQARATVAIRT